MADSPAATEDDAGDDGWYRNSDRRQWPRLPARVEVHFRHPTDAAKAFRVFSVNVSPGGLCVRTKVTHAVGDLLQLDLLIGEERFFILGTVAWVRSGVLGVRFDNVGDDIRRRLEAMAAAATPRPSG